MAEVLGTGLVVLGLQGKDPTYAWDPVTLPSDVNRKTLFTPHTPSSPRRIWNTVQAALDRAQPRTVAVPGWSTTMAMAALDWCNSRRVPAIIMSDSTTWDEPRRWYREAVKRRVVDLGSAALVAGRRHKDYVTKLGMMPERVFCGYDVVDNDYFQCRADRARRADEAWRIKLRLPDRYFLASSRFVAKKNLFRLVEAYSRYRAAQDREPWSLVVLGDGPERRDLEATITRLGLEEYVKLPGFRQYDELPVYYALAGAFVHSSTTEQWGLVVNEAMACGLPVIVSERCGCTPDLVVNGLNGMIFDPRNTNELVDCLNRMAQKQCDAQSMGKMSRQIISGWTPRIFAENILKASNAARSAEVVPGRWSSRLLLKALARR